MVTWAFLLAFCLYNLGFSLSYIVVTSQPTDLHHSPAILVTFYLYKLASPCLILSWLHSHRISITAQPFCSLFVSTIWLFSVLYCGNFTANGSPSQPSHFARFLCLKSWLFFVLYYGDFAANGSPSPLARFLCLQSWLLSVSYCGDFTVNGCPSQHNRFARFLCLQVCFSLVGMTSQSTDLHHSTAVLLASYIYSSASLW